MYESFRPISANMLVQLYLSELQMFLVSNIFSILEVKNFDLS